MLAVRDGAGWHLDPYTNNGESFYQLASDYTVTLDHPTAVLVPATGTVDRRPRHLRPHGHHRAPRPTVREFAWAAGPFSQDLRTHVTGRGAGQHVLDAPRSSAADGGQPCRAPRRRRSTGTASRFGAYPYGEVDVVLDNNFWFGGMEYPGFVSRPGQSTAVIHELGHQWFYGIVGDDEYNTPWLDEGFTDYATDLQQGGTGTNCWNSVSWQSSAEKITNSMAYWDAHSSRYSTVVYTYGKCALHDLRRLLGNTAMTNLMRSYAQAHWYGVTTVAEFKAAAQAATATNLTSFWTTHRI